MSPRVATARLLALGSLVALLLVLSVELLGIAHLAAGARAVLWALCIAPLLLFLPGLVRGAWKSYQWLCFVTCAYFFAIVEQVFRPTRALGDWIALVLVVALFVSAMMYSRWRKQELDRSSAQEAEGNG